MRNASEQDVNDLRRGVITYNVMFQDAAREKWHIKTPYTNMVLPKQYIIVERATTGEVAFKLTTELFAIPKKPLQKLRPKKGHNKGTHPELGYNPKLIKPGVLVNRRNGSIDEVAEVNHTANRLMFKYGWSTYLDSGRQNSEGRSPYDIVRVIKNEQKSPHKDVDGWILGNNVPKDGRYYFVKVVSGTVYIATSIHGDLHIGRNNVSKPVEKNIIAYKLVTHPNLINQ